MTITDPEASTTPITAGQPFNLLACIEGRETSDGRMFELGSTTWRDLPIPFMVQDTTPHGPGQIPQPAWAAGQIEELYRDPADPTRIMGRGHFMPNPQGERAAELLQHAFRGVSVDAYGTDPAGPNVQPTHVDQEGDVVGVLIRYGSNVISRVTMVPTPAIEPCCAWLDTEEMPDGARMAHGAVIPSDTEPEIVTVNTNAFEHMVAAGGGPAHPPRSWFFTPEPDHYQPIEVTPDGHWTGHVARSGQCYLGGLTCRTAPMSTSVPPYKGFHRTVARCDDGSEVSCGWVTMGTKHAPELHDISPGQVADQYDHTGTLGAKIRCSNGRHGVWSSGAIMPGLADRELAILQGPEVSGDWRHWTDPDTGTKHALELLGTLAVPFPAFPGTRTRPELLVASGGEIVGQRGQIMPCDDEGEPMTPEESEQFAALSAKVDTLERQNAAFLAAMPEVAAALANDEIAATAATTDEVAAAAHAFVDKNGDGKCDDCGMVEKMHKPMTAAGTEDISLNDDTATATVDLSVPLTASEQADYFGRYDAAALEAMARDGRALSDGSYAISDVADLQAAIRALAGAGVGASERNVRAHTMRAAARLERRELIPSSWRPDGSMVGARR